jgi:hypothetical protein
LKRCETWQFELDRRQTSTNSKNKSLLKDSQRPKSGRARADEYKMSQQDEKIVVELKQLIFKQEQLLRGNF